MNSERRQKVHSGMIRGLAQLDPAALLLGDQAGVYFGLVLSQTHPNGDRVFTWNGECADCDGLRRTLLAIRRVVQARVAAEMVKGEARLEDAVADVPFAFFRELQAAGCPHAPAWWDAFSRWERFREGVRQTEDAVKGLGGRLRAVAEQSAAVLTMTCKKLLEDVACLSAPAPGGLVSDPGLAPVWATPAPELVRAGHIVTVLDEPPAPWTTTPPPPSPCGQGGVLAYSWIRGHWELKGQAADQDAATFLDEKKPDGIGAPVDAAGAVKGGLRVGVGFRPDLQQAAQQPAGVVVQGVGKDAVGGVGYGQQVPRPERPDDVAGLRPTGDDDLRPVFVQKSPDV
jgi:hypothetical protein